MNYNEKTLPTREELAHKILDVANLFEEAKESKRNDDWADYYRLRRDLLDDARSIIHFEKQK